MCYIISVYTGGGNHRFRYPPDGLLTTGTKHDVDSDSIVFEPDPFASDDYLDDSPPDYERFLLITTDKLNTMNTGEDEPSSGLNGRLRPRKSTVPAVQTKGLRRSDGKSGQDRVKRTSSPVKASPNKPDDFSLNKSEATPAQQQLLCPYCDRKFAHKQTVSKHAQRVHLSASKQDSFIGCLFCNHNEAEPNKIIRHMVDSHPNQYFACLDCHTRFSSTSELAEHKLNVCEKQKPSYRSKLRQKPSSGLRKAHKKFNIDRKDEFRNDDHKDYPDGHGFNGIVISCELKPAQVYDEADIEDNITTNLILPPRKTLGTNAMIEKNAVIVLDDIQWNKRMPPNFTFHNTDADQILSRLGVVHRSPRTGESMRRDWFKSIDETTQKFEKCFDTSFYSKVASNVHENLAKFLDGSFNFNPDPDSTIKTRKLKNSVVINTAEGFPILLAYNQYCRNVIDGYMPRAIAPKHKWKWDNLESDRNIMNPDQIKRDSHANNCIITLVSSLDIWTQLCMRRKFENKFSCSPLEKKTEKQTIIGRELKEILESREIPPSSSQVVKYTKPTQAGSSLEYPALLGLTPSAPEYEVQPAVLSGEWVRPRCYVCCACGAQTRDSRALSSHMSSQHPNAQVQHYEIVGELLLNADILKHLYVPPSQMFNRTRPMRGFRECTKCKKSVTLDDLHQHMLDCAGDTPTVRRKCRYRPFGVRRRRPRIPDKTIRKAMRKDIRTRQRQKGHMRQRPRIRTEVGDAETIRKMIADLPAKRHRVMVNPMNSMLRPRKKLDKQRTKLMRKQRPPDDQINRRARMKDANSAGNNELHELNQGKSPTNKYDNENAPLKPRVKRGVTKNSRQSESLKRKSILNRAKRKVRNENIIIDPDHNPTDQPGNENINLSRDNLPQRVDVNGGPVNAREHAGREGPNNRGDQPADNRQNDNPNNAHMPAYNAPLKHSIASLTADSETHDKSVQFHHLFLVQQECNNVTQHVPTGQRQLFENEAAVTRLDKPPLSHQKPPVDPAASQKNKLNKPRKGLNDCIAMLRNKLVDPISPLSGQVSVQCGSDEPLDMEPLMIAPKPIPPDPQIDLRPAEIYSRHSMPPPETPTEVNQTNYNRRQRSATSRRSSSLSDDVTQKEMIKDSPKKPSLTLEVIPPKQKQPKTPVKRKSSRLRSTSRTTHEQQLHAQLTSLPSGLDPKQASNMVQALQLLQMPQALAQASQIVQGFPDALITPPKTKCVPLNVTETCQPKTTRGRPRRESYKKVETINELKTIKQNSVEINIINKPSTKKPVVVVPSDCRLLPQTDIQTEYNINTTQLVEQRSPEIQDVQQKQRSSSVHSENNFLPQNPAELYPQKDRTISDQVYVEGNFSDISVEIPPAHSSSIDSILSTPLDLSSKSVPIDCSEGISNLNSSYIIHSYDAYETLDLSNKKNSDNIGLEVERDASEMSDMIVDLRIRPSESRPFMKQTRSIDMCTNPPSLNDSDVITDLSIRLREEEYVPTDLSLRGRYSAEFSQSQAEVMSYEVQDLSGHKVNSIEDYSRPIDVGNDITTDDVPTDLSGKRTQNVSTIVSGSSPASEANANLPTEITMNLTFTEISKDNPADLSAKTTKIENSTELHTVSVSVAPSEPVKATELRNPEENNISKTSHGSTTRSGALPKPVYDPTLKIPQYKIRTTASTGDESTSFVNENSKVVSLSPVPPAVTHISTAVSCELSINYTTVANKQSQNPLYVDTSTQERLPYGFIGPAINVPVNTIVGSIPVYTLPNPIPSLPISKFESTTPVYTLANACISVTKIESSNLSTLTNTLLSIPGTTIANTTSVYTLAGTTIGAPVNYGGIPNIPPIGSNAAMHGSPLVSIIEPIMGLEKRNTTPIADSDVEQLEKRTCAPVCVEQDTETARKIAMLPKELVEILGTMPAGHRNQLLNVLPQYVSTSAAGLTSQSETIVQSLTSSDMTSPFMNPNSYVDANTAFIISEKHNTSATKMTPISTVIKDSITNQFTSLSDDPLDNDNKHSMSIPLHTSYLRSQAKSETIPEEIKPLISNNQVVSPEHLDTNKDNHLIDPSDALTNDLRNNIITETAIIDLTEDENTTLSTSEPNVINEAPLPVAESSKEEATIQTKKNKINSEKTASLRAVRIKAPSERNKFNIIDVQVHPKTVVEQQIKSNSSDQSTDDNESNKLSDSDKFLAIQQAEISSTQHSNKNILIGHNSSASVSPVDLETRIEENTGIQSKQNFISPAEVVVNKDEDMSSNVLHTSLKPIALISSISTNETNIKELQVEIPAKNINEANAKITPISSVFTSESCITEDKTIVSPNICSNRNDLNVAETSLNEYPIQSSTPKQNLIKEKEPNITEGNKKSSDEDSEDDISLAVIVKQKQLDQRKYIECENKFDVPQNDKSLTIKKKNEKKSNKKVQKSTDIKKYIIENDKLPIADVDNNDSEKIKDAEFNSNKLKNDFVKSAMSESKQVKKKNRISRNLNVLDLSEDKTDMRLNTAPYEIGINKENDTASESNKQKSAIIKTTACEDVNAITNEIVVNTKKPTEVTDDMNSPQEETNTPKQIDITENIDVYTKGQQSGVTEESELLDSIEKIKSKKKPVNKTLKETTETIDREDIRNEKPSDVPYTLNTGDEASNNVDKKSETSEKNIVQKDISHLEENDNDASDPENQDNKKVSNNTKTKNVEITEQSLGSDLTPCTEIEENTVVPLRRSRRGKSLYVDSFSGAENVVNSDVSFEQKTPLTKKQLIFSKLLLDEENQPVTLANHTSEEDKIVDNGVCQSIKNSSLNSAFQVKDVDFTESQIERNKPLKRKKSPQTRRKSKSKKKKTHDSQDLEKDTDNSHSTDKKSSTNNDAHTKDSEEKRNEDKPRTVPDADELNPEICKTHVDELETQSVKSQETPTSNIKEIDSTNDLEKEILHDKLSSSTEKRKLSLPTVSADIGHLPKPKKTKIYKNGNSIDSVSTSEEHNDDLTKRKDNNFTSAEVRTACYNRPVAARRTRSKSVFVKSSINEFYDPYDIDLDDMIQKSEPLEKKRIFFDEKIVGNHIVKIPHAVKSTVIKNNKLKPTVDEKVSKTSKKEPSVKNNVVADVSINDSNNTSDSDDSSKSDVPLKKYVEHKEKKLQEREEHILPERENEDDFEIDLSDISEEKPNDKEGRKSRRTLAVFNNVDTGATSTTESEEQLRSEQFMESFGFFSERKPRKSNLLASKKISETFHIIANESEDMFYGFKERPVKKSLQNENRKSVSTDLISPSGESNSKAPQHSPSKKVAKRGRKKKICTKIVPCFCSICKKEFKRPDNYLRHQMTLLHISKLSEVEMKVKTAPVPEEPNYLIVYKQHLDRLKILTDKLAKRKKNSKSSPKIILPTMEEIVADVNRTVREQQLSQRGLSRDEALFIDCCELLKESHKTDMPNQEMKLASDASVYATQTRISELDLLTKRLNEENTKSDGDVDSITAKNILESEEVRNLENDLISGLKEAANASNAKNIVFTRSIDDIIDPPEHHEHQNFSSPDDHESHYSQIDESFEQLEDPCSRKQKKHPEVKDKMYPDIIENIDMFEDKFDKIKRKCRSQAAAAKHAQTIIEPSASHKGRKKSEKKKGKKISKKSYQSTQVPTKGALKGFDGIKVSIPTSDINISAIVPSLDATTNKKKKKNSSRKKRDKMDSESSGKCDSDLVKDSTTPQRKVDVYEFMDNEDAELFEFRPSTLMERFKSISNKETPSTSKFNPVSEEADMSSDSVSDGDDFVYMSDDYVCSDDETETSLMSCELSVSKLSAEIKKNPSPLKRKDVVEKNAVMGKIFKHNAVRSEKKNTKAKETAKPKANLDQLFDQLLEEEPSSSMLNNDASPPRKKHMEPSDKHVSPTYSCSDDDKTPTNDLNSTSRKYSFSSSKDYDPSTSKKYYFTLPTKYESLIDSEPSTSRRDENIPEIDYGPSTSKKHDLILPTEHKPSLPNNHDFSSSKKYDFAASKIHTSPKYRDISTEKSDHTSSTNYDHKNKSPLKKLDEGIGPSYDNSGELLGQYCDDDTGVARQRARRKCAVGKQNVLAETWSSESEPDGVPPRPNSAESVVLGSGRRRKGKKKERSQSGGRRGSSRQVIFRRQDVESRVTSSSRNPSGSRASAVDVEGEESVETSGTRGTSPVAVQTPSASSSKPRSRATAYCWSSEGDEEQEHLQQHGWIVGDSHKKLVTMLAHAKGRKRINNDKRHLVE